MVAFLTPIAIGLFTYNLASHQFLIGRLTGNQSNFRQANKFAEVALNWLPESSLKRVRLAQARYLLALGKPAKAIAIMVDGSFAPDNGLLLDLGNCFWDKEDVVFAYFYWQQIPNPDTALFYQALEYLNKDDVAKALNYFEIGSTLNPVIDPIRNAEIYITFAQLYKKEGEPEKAISTYKSVRDSGYRVAWDDMQIGKLYYFQLKNIAAAEAYFRHAQAVDPNFHRVGLWLGLSLAQQKKFDGAIDTFEQGLVYTPNDGLLHFELAMVYQKKGELTLAKTHFRKSLELAPPPDAWEYSYVEQAQEALKSFLE